MIHVFALLASIVFGSGDFTIYNEVHAPDGTSYMNQMECEKLAPDALANLKQQYPDAHVSVMCHEVQVPTPKDAT